MEDKTPPCGEVPVDAYEIPELKPYWNKCLDSERCDSMELNPVLRQQIRQSGAPQDEKQSLSFPKQQLLNQSTLSHHRHLLQTKTSNSVSKEEYEHTIQILEKQKAELLKVNKQWDRHCRYIKESYENQVSKLNRTLSLLYQQKFGEQSVQKLEKVVIEQEKEKSKEEFTLELHKIKEENYILKRQNHVLRKKNDNYESEVQRLNMVLLHVTMKDKFDSINSTRLDPSSLAKTCEDFKTKNEVLIQQVKIYEEDFIKERADKENIRKEKEELQKILRKLRLQLHK